jgi:hypothetical protein
MLTCLPFLLFITLAWQEEIPYKPSSEYEVIIDYKFEDRPAVARSNSDYRDGGESSRNTTSGPLPYLKLELKLLTLGSEEVKVRVVDSQDKLVLGRKATAGMVIKLDVGFIADVKDRVEPNEYTVLLYSSSKQVTSRIHLIIMEDGTFLVNEVKKGKF